MSSNAPAGLISRERTQSDRLVYRELTAPSEVVALLRLRHRIYFEERDYGAPKPLGIDITAHDVHARLFGVFRGRELVGGLRLVFRCEQALSPVLRTVHAMVQGGDPTPSPACLPSEEAFDFSAVLGARAALIDVEVGRLIVARPGVGKGTVLAIMVATLGALLLERCRLYMYSCADELAERYARVTNPRWTLSAATGSGIRSDGFVFPRSTIASVAAAEDSPYLEAALDHAHALHQRGFVELGSHALHQQAVNAKANGT